MENLNSRLSESSSPFPLCISPRYFRIGSRKQVGGIDQPNSCWTRFINTSARIPPRSRSKGRPAQFRGTITIVIDATRQTRARKLRKYGWENVAGRKRKFVFPSNDSNLSCAPSPSYLSPSRSKSRCLPRFSALTDRKIRDNRPFTAYWLYRENEREKERERESSMIRKNFARERKFDYCSMNKNKKRRRRDQT